MTTTPCHTDTPIVDRLVLQLARATGQPEVTIRLAYGLEPCSPAAAPPGGVGTGGMGVTRA